jgi:hypothetical protein
MDTFSANAAAIGQPLLDIQILLIPCARSAVIAFGTAKLFRFISRTTGETNVCMGSAVRHNGCQRRAASVEAIAATAHCRGGFNSGLRHGRERGELDDRSLLPFFGNRRGNLIQKGSNLVLNGRSAGSGLPSSNISMSIWAPSTVRPSVLARLRRWPSVRTSPTISLGVLSLQWSDGRAVHTGAAAMQTEAR